MDTNAGLSGWSRMRVGNVKDISVTVDSNGQDTLWMTVLRTIQGDPVLNLECIRDWTDSQNNWGYTTSSVDFGGGYSTQISGLEHLEGMGRLQTLHLRGTRVTAHGVDRLQEALPDCKIKH